MKPEASSPIALSLVIPAHNEETRIGPTLTRYTQAFADAFKERYEILVILNGCRDRTQEVVERVAQQCPEIRWKTIYLPVGKGGALIEGFSMARGELVGFVDADGATPPDQFLRLVARLESGGDGAIASRWVPGSMVLIKQSWIRRMASRIFNRIVRILFRLPYKDTQCGGKVFRREALKSILPHLRITNFAFDVELLYLLKKQGYRIIEVPIVWNDQKDSTLNLKRVAPIMFFAVLGLRLRYSPVGRALDRLLES